MALERFIGNVLSFPSSPNLPVAEYNKELKNLNDFLNKAPAQAIVGTRDNDPLDLLDNHANSLGVLYVLLARLTIDKNEIQILWSRVIDFLSEFDGRQTQLAKDHVLSVVKTFLSFVEVCHKPILAIAPLAHVISQLNYPTGTRFFSPLHTKFAKKCLDAKCFRAALPVLDVDVEEFPARNTKEATYRDVLQYYVYGAMIYMGAKNWKRASEFLQFVISYPGMHASQIQIEAFKKYILVGLLTDGREFQFPKTVPQGLLKIARILSRPYEAFATAYSTGNPDVLRREAALVQDIFKADGNWGIAEQCLENFRRLGIKALTHTYSTLSVETIASRDFDVTGSRTGSLTTDSLEGYILDMIDRKEIRASLSHLQPEDSSQGYTSCMVSFHDVSSIETDILKDLEAQIARTVQITNQARQLDKKLGFSREWISLTNKQKGRGPGGQGSAMDAVDPGFEEEDYPMQGGGGRPGMFDYSALALAESQGFNVGDYAYDPVDDEMRPDYED